MLKTYHTANVELDDLKQWAIVGLCEAAERYDQRTGVPFRAYAGLRIRGSIHDQYKRQKFFDESLAALPDESMLPVDEQESREARDKSRLVLALTLLPLTDLEIRALVLDGDGVGVVEISRRVGETVAEVRDALREAQRKLGVTPGPSA